ncbi:peroxiredoxin [Haloglycomyces albus]|uniref:peroxiredoxin n=1 Tax=Haloglycomyces albus TaxID=526067 RepID=UPI00046CF189|nr:peroxiredoxin [Haloglycomyces albus]
MPLEVGQTAPAFTLKDQNNQEVSLSDFKGEKNVLLVFYPFAFTGVCEGELCGIRDNLSNYDNDDTAVLTVSIDSPFAHKVWAEREDFTFPLLSDFWPHGEVAQAFGVFNDEKGMANRGTFVIDKEGVVRFSEMNMPGDARDQSGWQKALEELSS